MDVEDLFDHEDFPTYTVLALYDDKSYALRVHELPGCFSSAEFPDEIEPMIRDAISIHQDVHLMDFHIQTIFVKDDAEWNDYGHLES